MTSFTDEQFRAAFQEVIGAGRALRERIDALEAKPNRDASEATWAAGRAYAQDKGYQGADLDGLEQFMQDRGIWRHEDAIAVDPAPPQRRGFPLTRIPADEQKLLFDGDEEAFLQLALRRARGGQ